MVTNTSGKKKTAVARATVSEGTGRVRINAEPVELVGPEQARLKMLEPFRIADDELRDSIDIDVTVSGGGFAGQADAARTAIARGLVEYTNDPELRDTFMSFDRSLLVNDVRQSESKKWGGPGARARYQKSYR
ncbi:30S ribosomal protein S9 [Natronomonas salsuginis]|uniref:Small ribosomal subunit protein uS9 n=1 Tax=Natronomonas salsuginis TaxID=2217661 RepID=A0A4V5ZP60_9EURY|nr:30S ribosomal protein S9 [Natronomonas salsuginis]TKR27753.1 30S ribosomal protein S9 [Natronomonas salsuginis]